MLALLKDLASLGQPRAVAAAPGHLAYFILWAPLTIPLRMGLPLYLATVHV
jgi:hypothetical protein